MTDRGADRAFLSQLSLDERICSRRALAEPIVGRRG
jgi:hypothetical protein